MQPLGHKKNHAISWAKKNAQPLRPMKITQPLRPKKKNKATSQAKKKSHNLSPAKKNSHNLLGPKNFCNFSGTILKCSSWKHAAHHTMLSHNICKRESFQPLECVDISTINKTTKRTKKDRGKPKKSPIRKTLNLSVFAVSSTDTTKILSIFVWGGSIFVDGEGGRAWPYPSRLGRVLH